MSLGVRAEVWGGHVLFSHPETKVKRCSYDTTTSSVARDILETIYWHPSISWRVDSIHVIKPTRFTSIRRNEVKSRISASNVPSVYNGAKKELFISSKEETIQRAPLLLKDMEYVISAHSNLTNQASDSDNPGKFKDIIMRRLRRGECYHTPYFGHRELPANFCLCKEDVHGAYEVVENKDLGFMLYDMDYSSPEDIQPMLFWAVAHHEIADLGNHKVIR